MYCCFMFTNYRVCFKSAFSKTDCVLCVSCVSGVDFMQCRFCKFTSSNQETLLKHFRLHHGQGAYWPCIHTDCVCVFKTPGALRSHLSRSHSVVKIHKNSTFQCELCDFKEICSEKTFWNHLGHHLKNRETVQCPFLRCTFKTNLRPTFSSHRS